MHLSGASSALHSIETICLPFVSITIQPPSSTVMSDHQIRHATTDDYSGVMAMGDMLYGIDYLKHRFHSFLNDPDATSYVYIVGDEIVGFCSAFLVDDGMTLLLRASRVKRSFQGHGIYGKLTRYVYAEYEKLPSVKYEVFTTNGKNYEVNKEAITKTYEELSRKTVQNYLFNVNKPTLSNLPDVNLKEVTSDDIMTIFAEEKTQLDLFPEGKIIINWVPLRFLPSNMKHIILPETRAFASKDDNSNVSLLTVGTPTPCNLGIRYHLDIFGGDVRELRHHIINHLFHIRTLIQGNVMLMILPDPRVETDVRETVKDLNLPEFDFEMTEMFNFEKRFDRVACTSDRH